MSKKVLVLGAGLVGLPMALDLAANYEFRVTVADIDNTNSGILDSKGIEFLMMDLNNEKSLKGIVSNFDYIVLAVPGFMGYKTLRYCIEEGADIIDIAFYPEDVMSLNKLAKDNAVRVISDIGVAPGMSNLLTGYAASKLQVVEDVKIFVGGLPKIRTKPWEYKAVFSPTDIIEEYTRPARIVRDGQQITIDPLTEIEYLEFDKVGTVEAFNSDGLRSLLTTVRANNMVEKTIRYPGYADKIKLLSENGFFSNDKIDINGCSVSPLDLTSKLLFNSWKLNKGEEDITLMRIEVTGIKNAQRIKRSYELYDEYCKSSGIHSMARTTGYTATTALRLLEYGGYTDTGISLGEKIGKEDKYVDFMLKGLEEHGVKYIYNEEYIQ